MGEGTVSYWNQTGDKAVYPRLQESIETDILIIGSGITGVTCAYCLTQKGEKPVLIEAGGLCDGTTGNTTGKVTIQHNDVYGKIFDRHGREAARLYADSQTEALDFIRRQVDALHIDCQLAENTAYLFASDEKDTDTIRREYEIVKELGIDAAYFDRPDFPSDCFGMVGFPHQLVFHAVRYVNALAAEAVKRGANIYCDTKAIKIKHDDITTVYCENDLVIRAKHVVQATQYPIYDGPNLFYTRLYAYRDYGIAVRTEKDWPDGSYVNVGDPTRSIRTHVENGKRVMIVVGETHSTGRGEDNMALHFENLTRYAQKIAGVNEMLAKWSAQDYDTPDHIPYIGRLSDHCNIYVAAGFKKWGLSTGTLAGMMIADLITQGNCRYEALYSRRRADYLSAPGKAITEVFSSVGELIKSKFERTDTIRDLQPGDGRVIYFNGGKAGIYRDLDDSVTILDISCTHMTTELNFNSSEKTWDCPAHGGRFMAISGKLLEGPPKDSLPILYQGNFSDLIVEKGR